MGTHPDHRRLGLGRVVMEAGVRRLAELGAAGALVLSHTANAASERLYASAGFEALTHHRAWTRPL